MISDEAKKFEDWKTMAKLLKENGEESGVVRIIVWENDSIKDIAEFSLNDTGSLDGLFTVNGTMRAHATKWLKQWFGFKVTIEPARYENNGH